MLVEFQHFKNVDACIDKAVNACIEYLFMLFWRFTGHDRDNAGLKGAKLGGNGCRCRYGILFGNAEDNNVGQ